MLDRIVRAAGRIEPDERRLYAISPKFEGYVERLYVNVTGQPVGKGQPLFEVPTVRNSFRHSANTPSPRRVSNHSRTPVAKCNPA